MLTRWPADGLLVIAIDGRTASFVYERTVARLVIGAHRRGHYVTQRRIVLLLTVLRLVLVVLVLLQCVYVHQVTTCLRYRVRSALTGQVLTFIVFIVQELEPTKEMKEESDQVVSWSGGQFWTLTLHRSSPVSV